MTLEQLRIFVEVATRLHVTQAAGVLNLTQSAVSASVAALEAQHGVRLFDRVGRRIELTEAGAIFLPQAQALMAQAEGTRLLLEDLSRETRGRLRLAASQTVANYWLPQRMVALHGAHPGITLSLSVANTAGVARAVQEGAADLGLVEGAVSEGDLHRQVVARDELVLVVAMSHPLAQETRAEPESYGGLEWILREPGSGTRSEFESHLAQENLGLAELTVLLELPSNEAVLAAVSAGQGVSVLSRRAVENAVAAGRVRALAIRAEARPFAVLSHPGRHRTRAVQAMLDLLTGPFPEA
jgi:DNA-binding transcriptional LysR family regulator